MITSTGIRQTGIGGSDIAAIAGLHPYLTAHDVYLEKLGLRTVDENEAMFLGRFFESRICDLYAEREDVTLIRPPTDDGILRSPDRPWMIGSPDRLVAHQRIGMDAKMAGVFQARRWGDEQSDRIPEEYHAQAQWYLSLTGFERWDVAVLLGQTFRIYRLAPHADLIDALISIGEHFWRDHVEKRVPPEIDYTDNARRMLQTLYPREQEPLRPATDEEVRLARSLREVQEELGVLDQQRHQLLNRLRECIGFADGIAGPGFRITWRRHKDHQVIDWEGAFALATALLPMEHIKALLARCTKTRPGLRVLRPLFQEASDD